MRQLLMIVTLAAFLAVSAGCGGETPPAPVPHKEGDGGTARPHGEASPKGRKAPPVLND